ncbi:MAG: hypothetical protein IJ804_02220 [Prevotella sp.]|nr:hypothetical protein [Prevotella sp.]
MKTTSLFIIMITAAQSLMGQVKTSKLTVYKSFKPSIILLKDGRQLKQPLTNIFLKNSSLLYMHGTTSMEANMDNILSVQFDDRRYVKIDSLLAYEVDSVGQDILYKATVIDMQAYLQQLKNNQVITSLSLGDQISTSSIDLSTEDDYKFPLIDIFYYRFNGKMVRVHERYLGRLLTKEQKRIMKTYMSLPDFSWTDEKSLVKLLKGLQQ